MIKNHFRLIYVDYYFVSNDDNTSIIKNKKKKREKTITYMYKSSTIQQED